MARAFESLVRQWCETYRPLADTQTNRRFFFTDSKENMIEMAKKWTPAMSPCVVMECAEEGGGHIERLDMNYPIYFFVRAQKPNDGDEAKIAVSMALQHLKQFLAWLRFHHNRELDDDKPDGDFARIKLDDAYIDITTVGPLGDYWYAELLQIEREEPLNLCMDPDLYLPEKSE